MAPHEPSKDASYRTVLVGTDGSRSSFRAVSRAAAIASDAGATLILACAYHPMPEKERAPAADRLGDLAYKITGSTPADDALRAAREHAVAGWGPRGGGKGGGQTADISVAAVEGDPVDVLVDLANKHDADLIVVGNRGLNSLSGRILGSVPANVSHKSRCDVLIVHTTSGR